MVDNDGMGHTSSSEYNEAVFQIQRINYLKQMRSEAMIKGQLQKAYWVNNEIFDNLSSDVKKLDKRKKENSYRERAAKIEKELRKAFKTSSKGDEYKIIRQYTQLLEELQDEAGKGGKYYDPMADGMSK